MAEVDFRLLRYFVAVAEELHFSRAAARLHIAQPALSQAIAKLERQIGFALFDRSRRSVALTEAGTVLLVRARRTLAEADAAIAAARLAHLGKVGLLRIGFTDSAPRDPLVQVLRTFRGRHPAIEFSLVRIDGSSQGERLLQADIHVAFGRREVADERLVVHSLRWDQVWAALPRDHRLVTSTAVALEALARDAFILPRRDASPAAYDAVVSLCRNAGFSPRVGHAIDRLDLAPGYVAAGLGVALVPEHLRLPGDRLVNFRPLVEMAAWLELVVTCLPGVESQMVDPFVAVAKIVAGTDREGWADQSNGADHDRSMRGVPGMPLGSRLPVAPEVGPGSWPVLSRAASNTAGRVRY
jgi:DNA-binding transcriptional LysR family regulator